MNVTLFSLPNSVQLWIFALSLLLGWFPETLSSQTIYSPGQVILLNGDTLQGLVGELGQDKRFSQCLYKANRKDKVKIFLPQEIQSFTITGRTEYTSRLFPTDSNSEQVFLEKQVSGILSVWSYKKQFILELAGEPLIYVPSKSQKLLEDEDRLNQGAVILSWRKFLFRLQEKCPSLADLTKGQKSLYYDLDELIELSLNYNECQGETSRIIGGKVPAFVFDFGPFVSSQFTRLFFQNVKGNRLRFLERAKFENVSIEAGLNIHVRSERYLSHFSFFAAPYIQSFNFKQEGKSKISGYYDELYSELDLRWMEIGSAIGIQYNLTSHRPQILIKGGIRLGFLFEQEVILLEDYVRLADDIAYATRSDFKNPLKFGSNQFGLITEVSIQDQFGSSKTQWRLGLGFIRSAGILAADISTPSGGSDDITSHLNTISLTAGILW